MDNGIAERIGMGVIAAWLSRRRLLHRNSLCASVAMGFIAVFPAKSGKFAQVIALSLAQAELLRLPPTELNWENRSNG